MNYNLIQWACDADMYNRELKARLMPTRALFTNVKELAYLSEVDGVLRKAVTEAAASGGPISKDSYLKLLN